MSVIVKRAGLAQLDCLVKWRMRVLGEVFCLSEQQPSADLERENCEYYKEALSCGSHVACLAYEGEKAVGCGGVCFYSELPSPDNPTGKCAYLMNIYISPEYRGRGAASEVVRWLVNEARERKASKIYLETSAAGRSVYEKAGFTPMSDMMKLKDRQ